MNRKKTIELTEDQTEVKKRIDAKIVGTSNPEREETFVKLREIFFHYVSSRTGDNIFEAEDLWHLEMVGSKRDSGTINGEVFFISYIEPALDALSYYDKHLSRYKVPIGFQVPLMVNARTLFFQCLHKDVMIFETPVDKNPKRYFEKHKDFFQKRETFNKLCPSTLHRRKNAIARLTRMVENGFRVKLGLANDVYLGKERKNIVRIFGEFLLLVEEKRFLPPPD